MTFQYKTNCEIASLLPIFALKKVEMYTLVFYITLFTIKMKPNYFLQVLMPSCNLESNRYFKILTNNNRAR